MTTRNVARPDVLRLVPSAGHVVIEASAGTGKTFTLEHLVVDLLLSTNVAVDRLLIVTFTEKATHELRARVRSKIEELSSGAGDLASADQIRRGDFWAIDDDARAKLGRALHTFDGASIATIHAFCQRVLRENAFAGGRLFEERQVDAREAFGRALRDALRQELAPDPKRADWLEAALGAGWSIGRIEELLWRSATARGQLKPAFDAQALALAIEAFPIEAARHPELPLQIKNCGIHLNSARAIARRLYALADLVEQARTAQSSPRYLVLGKDLNFGDLLDKLTALSPEPGPFFALHAAAIDLARESPPFPAALVHAILPALLGALTRSKRESGLYDFDDMLGLVDEALRSSRGPALADSMQRRFGHVFIDEFQDTDETQWSIFRRAFFAREGAEPPSRLFLIGDPKQSIYRFRGADIQTYLRARGDILASGGALVPLERNYRATPLLVDATNLLFDAQAAEPLFTGDIRYAPVVAGRPERQLVDGQGVRVSPVSALRFRGDFSLESLGAAIAREIRKITDPACPFRLDGRALSPRDIFVLTRTAREGLLIGAELREADVPHAFYKEEGLFQSEEANDVRAVLLAIDDPRNRANRLSAWMTPFFGLVLTEVEYARDLPETHPFVERLIAWKELADRREFERLFERILQGSGILRREIFFASGERSLTNYLHLFELLVDRARAGHKTLGDLATDLAGLRTKTKLPLDLEGNVQRLESESAAVQIMTIHKAKGLEAPVVFIAGGLSLPRADEVRVYHEDGRRMVWVGPSSTAVTASIKTGEREEDQRLMYVALTRAMGGVYVPCVIDAKGSRPRRGSYEPVNKRIAELVDAEAPGLTVSDVSFVNRAPSPTETGDGEASAPYCPPWQLLRNADERPVYDALRAKHAGATVTSYTRMKASRKGARASWTGPTEDRREQSAIEHAGESPGHLLRGARTSGIFLHELLERVPIESFALPSTLDAWRTRSEVKALVTEAMTVHRVDPVQRGHAEELVWRAYTTPLTLPGGHLIKGLAFVRKIAREMEFVFPITAPQSAAPRAGHAAGVYVRGSLDLAFEHEGLTHFVDWKSDSLSSYEPEMLAGHVAEQYQEQLKLYTLAIVRLLGVKDSAEYESRFGGIAYCFLRGLNSEGAGLWSLRPSFSELRKWDEELRNSRPLGKTTNS